MPRWSVDLIVGDLTRDLGAVEAVSAKEAIEKAMTEFNVELAHRKGIRVTKVNELDDWP
jgi:hypothetical protein